MQKLKIDVAALTVDSFVVPAAAEAKGTVMAREHAAPSYPDPIYTCQYHCTFLGPTCEAC